jgi:hypothetical protein
LGTPARPSTPKVVRAKERAPTPSPSDLFTFELTNESIKELGGASEDDNNVEGKEKRWSECYAIMYFLVSFLLYLLVEQKIPYILLRPSMK